MSVNCTIISSPMSSLQVGPKRDVLTELYNASLAGGLSFGIYYSQGEWFGTRACALSICASQKRISAHPCRCACLCSACADADFVADHKNGFNSTTFIEKKVVGAGSFTCTANAALEEFRQIYYWPASTALLGYSGPAATVHPGRCNELCSLRLLACLLGLLRAVFVVMIHR